MARAASATGWMVPSSLFTSIMDTSTVSGRRAAVRSSMEIWPVLSGLSQVTSYPSRSRALQGSSTAACSKAVVMICFPFRLPSSTAPRMAQLSPSVPQEVKKISSGAQPRAAATWPRCSFSRLAASRPRG